MIELKFLQIKRRLIIKCINVLILKGFSLFFGCFCNFKELLNESCPTGRQLSDYLLYTSQEPLDKYSYISSLKTPSEFASTFGQSQMKLWTFEVLSGS